MSRTTIRVLIVLAAASIIGIIVTQVYWFKRAFDVEEEQFNREVNTALFNVANQFFEIDSATVPANNPIKQLSTNYYVVMINNEIDARLLEYLLTTEFEKRNITADFEYGIYDCTNEKMVYGSYISMNNNEVQKPSSTLPKWENQNYYFGVQFPNKASIITDRMSIWVFSTIVLLIVIIFFAYALFIILRQRRLSEIQKDFVNNMTHEFKTPISTIALSAGVLKNPSILNQPERMLNYAGIIENESHRLKNQVERVLQMASINNKEVELTKEKTDVHDIIRTAVDGLQLKLDENNGTINVSLKAKEPMILADRLHFTNVIHNLLDNAIKYSTGEPKITICTENMAPAKLLITIRDNGIGIAKEYHKNVFKKFFRVPTGNIHDVKGFGLGLNYVDLIVKAHKGDVTLESAPEAGSTFKLILKNA